MCLFGGNRTTQQVTSGPTGDIQNIGRNIAKEAEKMSHMNFMPYTGERVAGMSSQQQDALNRIQGLAQNQPMKQVWPQAQQMIEGSTAGPILIDDISVDPTTYQAAGISPVTPMQAAQTADPGRVVDEGGALGAVSDYTNPYVDNVLQNTIDRLDEQASVNRNRLGDMAAFAGAFGDARHGIESGLNERNLMDTIARTADSAYADAYNNAMALRGQDLNRQTQVGLQNTQNQQQANLTNTGIERDIAFQDAAQENLARRYGADVANAADMYNADAARAGDIFNANQAERGYDRMFRGGTGLTDTAGAVQSADLETLASYLGAGALPQSIEQAGHDADYQEFLRSYQHYFDRLGSAAGAISGVPYQTQQVVSQPDNSGFGGIAALMSMFL